MHCKLLEDLFEPEMLMFTKFADIHLENPKKRKIQLAPHGSYISILTFVIIFVDQKWSHMKFLYQHGPSAIFWHSYPNLLLNKLISLG